MAQLTKNQIVTLRAISVTLRPDGTLKASEPSQKGLEGGLFVDPSGDKLAPACRGIVVEAAGGGEYWMGIMSLSDDEVLFDRVRVSGNKVAGAKAAVEYVTSQGKGKAVATNGHTKLDPVAEYHAAKAAVEAAEKNLAAAKANLIQKAADLQTIAMTAEAAREEAEALVAEANAS